MAQTIKLKRSAQSGASGIPSTSDLALGEVGINTYHGKMYIKKDDGTESIVEVGSTNSFLPLSGGTLTGNLNLGDNVKLQLGNQTNGDLQIYHDGSNSYIADVGTGVLNISGSSQVNINASNGENAIQVIENAGVRLRHNNIVKLDTTSTGIDVTGSVTADGLTVDSGSGNIGIVTKSTDQFAFIGFEDNTSATSSVYIGADGNDFIARANSVTRLRAASNGDISFYEDTGTTPKMVWDASAEELQIGGNLLNLSGVTSGTTGARISGNGNGTLRFASGGVDALTIVDGGAATFSGSVTANAGLAVDNITIDGNEIDLSSGDLTLDVAGKINLDHGSPEILLKDDGTHYASFISSNTDFVIQSILSDKDMLFKGQDGSSTITALTLDMSNSGSASFSNNVNIPNGGLMVGATTAPTDKVDVAGAIRLTSNISFDANKSGRIYKASNHGLAFHGVTGTENDFALFTPSGQLMVVNPTGTNNVALVPTASSGRVGIGTSSPIQKLHVAGNIVLNASGFVGFGGGTNYIEGSSTNLLKFGTNNTERMRIDSSGNLLVGKTSASSGVAGHKFSLTGAQESTVDGGLVAYFNRLSSDGEIVRFDKANAQVGSIGSNSSGGVPVLDIATHPTSGIMRLLTSGTERMRIDSSGRVGIGCSPSTQMELSFAETVLQAKSTNASNFSSIRSMNSDSNQTAIIQYGASKAAYGAFGSGESAFYSTTATTIMSDNSSSGVIKFATGGNTERMRLNADGSCRWTPDGTNHDMTLDANGDLLVGKTSADFTTAGHEIKPNSFAGFTRDGGSPVIVNRLTNSGHLVEFYQGTSTVGSIASVDANSIKIGKGNSNLRFYDFGASGVGIIPCTSTGANSLNAVDLGNASSTFKDLYLSGGVIGGGAIQSYAGTQGAAAFRPNNDLNTGIFFPAADTFAVTTGGSEAYRVDSFGNLLVGTNDTDTQNNNAGSVADNGFVYNKGSGGYLNVARYGGTVAYFNRTSSVGTIQEFRADGVAKGNISVSAFGMGFGGGTRSSDFFIKTDGTASFASGVNLGVGTGSPATNFVVSNSGAEGIEFIAGSTNYIQSFNRSGSVYLPFKIDAHNIMLAPQSGGSVLIGCTSAGDAGITLDGSPSSNSVPSMELVRDFSGTATMIRFTNISGSPYVGSITSTTSATAYNTSSDERLKDNIVDAPTASKDIDAIQVRSFDWKADGEHQKYGMVAQELLEVAPDAVTKGDTPDDMMGVDYSKLVPMLIKEIQSLRNRVAQLEE